ncbi:ABC transporter permease [Pantoea cypripedii]|uniref:ABC transporter permease n=1 Tax=Pantoea cypripedii TaxID=55209 RepID=UPI002FCAAF05
MKTTLSNEPPLLQLSAVTKHYGDDDNRTTALTGISLSIQRGEMVALMGPSGSGKSTLLNILGCLDAVSQGSYLIEGRDTRHLSADELAWLRRKYFGFVFQRYQLITRQSASDNVALPAIYAGLPRAQRQQRAQALLARLGLAGRGQALPGQLSGGQQQRVSIARALTNGGEVILADEPTGALDRQTGAEVMAILRELQTQGHTVIIVTHDASVAALADRVIRICDGALVADERTAPPGNPPRLPARQQATPARLDAWYEALRMALAALRSQPLRAALTMLGIIIGITAVSCMVGLGQGARERVVADIKAMGYNTFTLYPGSGWGDRQARFIRTLTAQDAALLRTFHGIEQVSPLINTSAVLQNGRRQLQGQLLGVSEHYFALNGKQASDGALFSAEDVRQSHPAVVIDDNTRRALFDPLDNPVGKTIQINDVIATVAGIIPNDSFQKNAVVYLPFSVLQIRQRVRRDVDAIMYKVSDGADTALISARVTQAVTLWHGKQDFFIFSAEEVTKAVEKSAATLTLLVLTIAFIALLIGGIGVMNMMLVSVTERTHEIGVRLALGARQRDILQQFLSEALVVCSAGGLIGVLLSAVISQFSPLLFDEIPLLFSPLSVAVAVACSMVTGLVFGYVPAQRAARLHPVVALSRE